QVLDVAGDQVPVVRQPVGEGRPVVEHELIVRRALPDRLAEGVAGVPVVQHLALERGKVRLGGYVAGPGARVDNHWFGPRRACGGARGRRARSRAGVPRYHLACRLPATARQPAVTGRTRPVLVGLAPFLPGAPR